MFSRASRLWTGQSRVQTLVGARDFSSTCRPAVEPTWFPIQSLWGALSPAALWSWPLTTIYFQAYKWWCYTCSPHSCLQDMCGDNFTFYKSMLLVRILKHLIPILISTSVLNLSGISSSLTTFFVTNYDTVWVVPSGENSSCKTDPCWLYMTVLTILTAILCAMFLTCVGQSVQTPTTHCTWPEDRDLSRWPSPLGTFACKNVDTFYFTAMFKLLVYRPTDYSQKFYYIV